MFMNKVFMIVRLVVVVRLRKEKFLKNLQGMFLSKTRLMFVNTFVSKLMFVFPESYIVSGGHIDMPHKMDKLAKLRAEIILIEEEEGYTILQVNSAQAKIDALMLCRDTEHNYRYGKFGATHILCKC